jgi:hypothetical protein
MGSTRFALISGFLPALLIAPALAQEQTLIVSEPLKTCSSVSSPLTLTEAEAATMITEALGAPPTDGTYYILHAVKYGNGRLTVESQDWYVYFKAWMGNPGIWAQIRDPRIKKHFQEARIYGSANVAMVYLHQNVATVDTAAAVASSATFFLAQAKQEQERDARAFEQSLANIKARLPQATVERAGVAASREVLGPDTTRVREDVRLMAQLRAEEYVRGVRLKDETVASQLSLVDRATGLPLEPLSDTLLTTSEYRQLASLAYKIAVTKKVPAPLQNLKTVVETITGQAQAATVGMEVKKAQALCAGQQLHIDQLPSDMAVTALTGQGKEEKELSKQTFDNERMYRFDVSFALPLKSHTDLSLDSSGGEITAKQVEEADLFAVLNVSPWAYDTKKPQAQILPIFMYGMPITGKPLHHHLAAVGFGLNRLQVFVGWRFDRIEVVSTTEENGVTTGTLAPPATGKTWDTQFVWGINLPVRTVVDLLKPKKK